MNSNTLNPNAKAFFAPDPLAQEFQDPFNDSEPEDVEFIPISPGLTMGVSKTIYQTGIKIAHITYNNLLFEVFLDKENNVAILMIPDRVYNAFFPLHISIRDVIYYYFGDKLIISENDSFELPMSNVPFSVVDVQ
jgi:hypothetical protein